MSSSLTKFKGFIHTYSGMDLGLVPHGEMEELKNFVTEILLMLRRDIEEEMLYIRSEKEKAVYIGALQLQLGHLADEIAIGLTENDQQAPGPGFMNWTLESIFGILDYIRISFHEYFNFNAELPQEFIARVTGGAGFAGVELVERLESNNADPQIIALVARFVKAGGNPDKFSVRTWRQWDYLLNFSGLLCQFMSTPPKEHIDLELLKLFISLDFNSIHVYAYILKYIERTTLSEASFQEQQEDLLYLLKTFRQVRVEADGSYDTKVQTLKTSVIECLMAEINYLEEKEKLFLQNYKSTTGDNPSRFYFTVAVTLAELMFFFRILLEVGMIFTKFNSYLYEFISNHIKTQRAENISKKSMRNHFSSKPFPDRTVQNVRNWLVKMISHIDLYYKF